ncbi:MAG TPA: hypothetical protein EYQ21_05975 [Flavobacteriales bacterium]|nr:hypothetical protein [Flavobacteriales bacterium]
MRQLTGTKECDRCKIATLTFTMSWFNEDYICMKCDDEEGKHPDFKFAKDVEVAYTRLGNMNYPGVGYPGKDGRISEELKQALIEELGL